MTEAPDDDGTDSPWTSTVVLGDGETALIRPLTPDDQEALLAFHERQSPESQYRRYFSPKPTLSARELDHFTAVDMVDRAALAVEIRDEFVAWASYERWAGRDDAEAAFMVADDHGGRGIATLLLEHLAAIARAAGIERFTAEVLAENRGMLAVFSKAGWPLERRFESGVIDLDWELAATDEFLDSVEKREQRADSRAVARILFPRAIAVVGASDRPHSVGRLLWEHVRSSVDVPVHPVNRRLEDLDGVRCYGDVSDLPDDVSLAIIAVPTRSLTSTIDACIAKRMRGAIIVTSPRDDDVEVDLPGLVARARRNGLRVIGPSSMGVASLHSSSRMQAALVDVDLAPGGVAISMQSGTLGASLLRRAHDVGLGVSWFVSLGDKSDVSANDLLQFWEDDERTTVIALYTETLGNTRKFARIARRVSRTRPIVAVRTGATGDRDVAALDQSAGLIEVDSVQSLIDTCRVLSCQPVLRGPRVGIVSNSDSPTTLTEAALRRSGLDPVRLSDHLGWRSDGDSFADAIRTGLADDSIDGLMVLYAPPIPAFASAVANSVDRAARGAAKPVVAVMIGASDGPIVPGSSVPGFTFPEAAAAVLGRAHRYARWLELDARSTPAVVRRVDPHAARRTIAEALPADEADSEPVELDLARTIELLRSYGITAADAEAAPADDAVEAAHRIGFPVALKAARRRPGRSVAAGLALDLVDDDDVRESVEAMRESLGDDAASVVVQRMTAPGINARITCEFDDRVGVVVSVGYGGEDADIVDDRASRIAPLSPAAAAAALGETRLGAAIRAADRDASPLVDLVVLASQLCTDHAAIDLLDLNPVVIAEDEAVVVDAVVRLAVRERSDGALRRL